jgi:hypothetical protein
VSRSFAFRPRFKGIAYLAMMSGPAAALAGYLSGYLGALVATVIGCAGIMLGVGYLRSPAWRFVVTVNDSGLSVSRGDREVLKLDWDEISKVVASPSTHTCYVDGGTPAQSLLVPGEGASASYDIDNKSELVGLIIEGVADEQLEIVDYLDRYLATRFASPMSSPAR